MKIITYCKKIGIKELSPQKEVVNDLEGTITVLNGGEHEKEMNRKNVNHSNSKKSKKSYKEAKHV